MKQFLLKAIVIAILFGSVTGFLDSFIWIGNSHKFDPPLSTIEAQQLARLPVAEMQVELRQREVQLTRMGWLADAIRYPYFWKGVAQKSVIPTFAIFLACVGLGLDLARALSQFGYIVTRQTGSHMRLASRVKDTEHHVTIPAHDPLRVGTLSQILSDVSAYLEMEKDAYPQSSLRLASRRFSLLC